MTDKKVLNLHEFRTATDEAGGSVPLLSNGHPITGVDLRRNGDGDLEINLLSQDVIAELISGEDGVATRGAHDSTLSLVPVPAPFLAPVGHEPRDMAPDVEDGRLEHLTERRTNNPASLTEDERIELAHLEQLAGVDDQRAPVDPL